MVVWSLLKTNCLNGVVKAVSIHESSESSIYQNPQLASSLLNTCAPASCTRSSSTVGNGWTFDRTLSLRDQKSTQMRTAPDFFRTTTIPAHQGAGSSTGEMTPSDCMRESSSLTFCLRGSGTFLGMHRANGCASGLSRIL